MPTTRSGAKAEGRLVLGLPDGPREAVLAALSVLQLWRIRRVCRTLEGWAALALRSLPRPVAVGGSHQSVAGFPVPQTQVMSLDLSTMQWKESPALPHLLVARCSHAVGCFPDGRVVAAGGQQHSPPPGVRLGEGGKCAEQWTPASRKWMALPDLPE